MPVNRMDPAKLVTKTSKHPQVPVRLSVDHVRALNEVCAKEKVSRAQLMRILIVEGLRDRYGAELTPDLS